MRTYVRIYCNGKKIRSTGSTRWWVDSILKDYEKGFSRYSRNKDLWWLFNQVPHTLKDKMLDKGNFIFSYEVMRKYKDGRKIVVESGEFSLSISYQTYSSTWYSLSLIRKDKEGHEQILWGTTDKKRKKQKTGLMLFQGIPFYKN